MAMDIICYISRVYYVGPVCFTHRKVVNRSRIRISHGNGYKDDCLFSEM
jgi:hypothetical protein